MRLIIPAAGAGIRLGGSMDNPIPKLLIPIRGRPLISHLLRIASSVGSFSDVILVLGPDYERAVQTVRDLSSGIKWNSKTMITCLKNSRYRETNNIYSLYLAREFLDGDVVIHNSDVLVAPSAFGSLLSCVGQNEAWVLVTKATPIPKEETKIIMTEDRIGEFGENITPETAHGRYVGVSRFTPTTSKMLKDEIESLIERRDLNVFYTKAIDHLATHSILRPVWVEEARWLEIDTWEDLKAVGQRAKQIIEETKPMDYELTAEVTVRDLDS